MVTIEPIKNQYLTALKERQQIIDKLNEIISGLNALDFDDLTTIHAELVAIRESLQTQNTAITEINNSIGQIETELTSFDNRLITLNTNIENTESNLTSFENDTALNLQSKVNKNGDTMTGNLGIPTTTTGSKDNFAVNGERLQNDLDNYSPMVRTSGTQFIYGRKAFDTPVFEGSKDTFRQYIKFTDVVREELINKRCFISAVLDSNDKNIASVEVGLDESGKRAYYAIGFGGIIVNNNFLNSQLRVNLTETGVALQLFDPINKVWKTAVLQ